jgi:hypothetical protein
MDLTGLTFKVVRLIMGELATPQYYLFKSLKYISPMVITKDILLARKKEIEEQKRRLENEVHACFGALQMLELLITTASAPEPSSQVATK